MKAALVAEHTQTHLATIVKKTLVPQQHEAKWEQMTETQSVFGLNYT